MTYTTRALVVVVLMQFLSGCSTTTLQEPPPNPDPITITSAGGTKIHIVQTGWVSVKDNFREISGPESLRTLSIVLDRSWTEWMPIQLYVIEHPEGIVLLDTGETSRVNEADYFNCDPGTNWFYLNQLRFAVNPEDELGDQLAKLGISTDSVRWTVLSHLHSDHMGGLEYLTDSEILISRADANGHQGALLCRLPKGLEPKFVDYTDEGFGAFDKSYSVTADGSIRIVPTPGHTAGHQSLLLKDDGKYYLFAGDAIFDLERLDRGTAIAGIVEDVDAAKDTVLRIERQLRDFDTYLAPAHDHGVRHRHKRKARP